MRIATRICTVTYGCKITLPPFADLARGSRDLEGLAGSIGVIGRGPRTIATASFAKADKMGAGLSASIRKYPT